MASSPRMTTQRRHLQAMQHPSRSGTERNPAQLMLHSGASATRQLASNGIIQMVTGTDVINTLKNDLGSDSFFSIDTMRTKYSGASTELDDFIDKKLNKNLNDLGYTKEKEMNVASGTTPYKGDYYCLDANHKLPVDASDSSSRDFYGFDNPSKSSGAGNKIMMKGLENLADVNQQIANDKGTGTTIADLSVGATTSYLKDYGTYTCKRTNETKLAWDACILGHDDTTHKGASGYFNDAGHENKKATNKAWNKDPDNYWGPEKASESSRSGSAAPRYRTPLRELGSCDDWI
ncbi:hypothetical protein AEM42_01845 [Betaproteobacteria bacterium UKL13-2]|nr:hypothetical protein AEM42_01845 [Betaproteobacteria bacterium UKL13-2]